MKNRIDLLFSEKKKNILSIYCTAGYPALHSTVEVLAALQEHGADMIEIGMPYSDPLADGPVIQQSNMAAIENGMCMPVLFAQLIEIRKNIQVPVILMGYLNPVLQYGIEKFCAAAAAAGIDGVIIPDLPMYEYETFYQSLFDKYQLHFIFLITPETSEERIRKIDGASKGFIYAVSSSAVTGNQLDIAAQEPYFKRLNGMHLKNPVLVGFGINDALSFKMASQYAHGAIIGSAYIMALQQDKEINATTKEFLNNILS